MEVETQHNNQQWNQKPNFEVKSIFSRFVYAKWKTYMQSAECVERKV